MLILIAGPYRSGANDDPNLIKQNLDKLEAFAVPIFNKGHVPLIGEWAALPIIKLAGSEQTGDDIWNTISLCSSSP